MSLQNSAICNDSLLVTAQQCPNPRLVGTQQLLGLLQPAEALCGTTASRQQQDITADSDICVCDCSGVPISPVDESSQLLHFTLKCPGRAIKIETQAALGSVLQEGSPVLQDR